MNQVSVKADRTFQILSIAVFVLVLLFQWITLNHHDLNGDEGIYSLIKDEFLRILQGHLPQSNPVIDYAGPLDFWIMGSVYGIIDFLFGPVLAEAWMVRSVPLVLWAIGTGFLFSELRSAEKFKRFFLPKDTSSWFLLLSATSPMILVFTRLSFPHSLLLGLISLLLASVMKGIRLGKNRLLTWILFSGIAIETHTSGFLAVATIVLFGLTNISNISQAFTRSKSILSCILFTILLIPIFKNFPPPLSNPDLPIRPFLFQIRNVFTILSGTHPLEFWITRDYCPPFISALYGITLIGFFLFFVFRAQIIAPAFKWYAYSHFLGFILIAWMARLGRSLETLGNDRYLLFLIPGFIVITAISMAWALSRTKPSRIFAYSGMICLIGLATIRFAIPIASMKNQSDPNREIASYLVNHCKPDSCVAEVENFWAYWPIRYYTFGRINLNVYDFNWKKVPPIETDGKSVFHCKFRKKDDQGPFGSDVVTFGSMGDPLAQICYFIQLAYR